MEIWDELAGWEKVSIIVLTISTIIFIPAIKYRALTIAQIIFYLLLIVLVSWLAPIVAFSFAAWGFDSTAYILFFILVLSPQFMAWRANLDNKST